MPKTIDILDRQPFVESLIDVVRKVADSGRGCTFSIDGQWGCGKTFVLDMFEQEISLFQHPDACGDRYMLFRYNCWEYDYYDEPIVAMVAAIRDDIESKKTLLPTTSKQAKAILKVAQKLGVDLLNSALEKKLGIKSAELMKHYSDAVQGIEAKKAEDTSFDSYFSFKAALTHARTELQKLATDKPIIFLVDELDRCLPEYAIKVLERLHHLLDGIPNVIVILAVDGRQLNSTVKKIYGDEVDTDQYLRKFISFRVELNNGSIADTFWTKHAAYLSLFDTPNASEQEFLNDLATNLFSGIDVRAQEKIIDRAMTLHALVFSCTANISILYFELIYQALTHRNTRQEFKVWVTDVNRCTYSDLDRELGKTLHAYIKSLEQSARNGEVRQSFNMKHSFYPLNNSSLGMTYWYLASLIHPIKDTMCGSYVYDNATALQSNVDLIKKFDQLSIILK